MKGTTAIPSADHKVVITLSETGSGAYIYDPRLFMRDMRLRCGKCGRYMAPGQKCPTGGTCEEPE